jgi:hypothetical protein
MFIACLLYIYILHNISCQQLLFTPVIYPNYTKKDEQ